MAKLKYLWVPILLIIGYKKAASQSSFLVHYSIVDSASHSTLPSLTQQFASLSSALQYLDELPKTLQSKGYISASIDDMHYDTAKASVQLFLGDQFKWTRLRVQATDEALIQNMRWKGNAFANTLVSFTEWESRQQQLLDALEENGYPFAKVFLDSIVLSDKQVDALLQIQRGPLYKIDSIRVFGDVTVSNSFLQRYLNIYNGSIYSRRKLSDVSRRLSELPYIVEERPSSVSYLATGSVLNLYLKPKKNSQVNFLAGLLPNSDAVTGKKFQFTVDANILLRNALAMGETIGLTWQKLQPQSQRLNLLYEHPYVFKSPFGLGFNFAMFRKDSTFLNIDMKIDARYGSGEIQSASFFLLRRQSIVNGINTAQVLFSKRLPQEIDVNSNNLGVTYNYNNTNYRFNPQKGNELVMTVSAGTKRIKKNNLILELKDPNDPTFTFEKLYDSLKQKSYQFRVMGAAAHFFKLGKQSTIKLGVNGGVFSSENIFRNELFQIGGYKLLRGFDEESQYVSQYAITTLEYRYLIGQNSHFFAFVDGGWAKHMEATKNKHTYIGSGVGLSFETKAGLVNLAWALGKRDDTDLNLRQSKVHLGFVNYF